MMTAINTSRPTSTLHLPPIQSSSRGEVDFVRNIDDSNRYSREGNLTFRGINGGINEDNDHVTNYNRDYSRKVVMRPKQIRNDRSREDPGKFEGEPTYRDEPSIISDYRHWDVNPHENVHANSIYRPPSTKFEATTNYTSDYAPRVFAPLSVEPKRTLMDRTDRWQPNPTAPMSEITNYMSEYTQKGSPSKRSSYKPDQAPYHSEAPFDDATTQATSYKHWKVEKPFSRHRDQYKRPEGNMDWSTTSRKEYTRKPMDKTQSTRRKETRDVLDPFDGTTNYHLDYRNNWDRSQRNGGDERTWRQQSYRPKDVPLGNDVPFETSTQYRDQFVQHRLPEKRSREQAVWKPSDTKLDTMSSYQNDFLPKELNKRQSCRPPREPYRSDAIFDPTTTSKTDYKDYTKFYDTASPSNDPDQGHEASATTSQSQIVAPPPPQAPDAGQNHGGADAVVFNETSRVPEERIERSFRYNKPIRPLDNYGFECVQWAREETDKQDRQILNMPSVL